MDRRIELTLFDPENRRALAALLPEAFVKQIENLWNGPNSHLLGLGEWELYRTAKSHGRPLSPTDSQLRMQFWFEYNAQQEDPDPHYPQLNMSRIIGRATAKENFYRHIITDPIKLAWILTPPTNYINALDLALMTATQRMIEICEMPLTDEKGRIDGIEIGKMSRILENFHRYIRSMKGDIINPAKEGRRPGQAMSQGKIEEAKYEPTAEEKIAALKSENEQLRLEKDNARLGSKD